MHGLLIDIGRIGIGCIFLFSVVIDFKMRPFAFALMERKDVPLPWMFFLSASIWKILTCICLIFNVYTLSAALLLALYIFLANFIFCNFWAVPEDKRFMVLSAFIVNLAACCGLLVIAGTV